MPFRKFRKHIILKAWKKSHSDLIIEKFKIQDSLQFRDRLLKQKVMYILYKYAQSILIPKKKYYMSLKTKVMFSWIQWHKKMKKIKSISNKYLSDKAVRQMEEIRVFEGFSHWKELTQELASKEKEEIMIYSALQFRVYNLCK